MHRRARFTRRNVRYFPAAVACLASVFEWGVLLRSSAGLGVRSPVDHAEGHQHHHLFSWQRLSSSYLQSLFFAQLLPAGVGGDGTVYMVAQTLTKKTPGYGLFGVDPVTGVITEHVPIGGKPAHRA